MQFKQRTTVVFHLIFKNGILQIVSSVRYKLLQLISKFSNASWFSRWLSFWAEHASMVLPFLYFSRKLSIGSSISSFSTSPAEQICDLIQSFLANHVIKFVLNKCVFRSFFYRDLSVDQLFYFLIFISQSRYNQLPTRYLFH